MADLIADAITKHNTWRKSHTSRSITYARGDDSVVISQATVAQTKSDVQTTRGATGVVIRRAHRDYIFDAADLVLDGSETVPAHDDTITETINGKTVVSRVVGPAMGESCFSYIGPDRAILRVHTKEVSVT